MNNTAFEALLHKLTSAIRDGLKHGHFSYQLESEIEKGGVRHVILKAGKSYKFHISEQEANNLTRS